MDKQILHFSAFSNGINMGMFAKDQMVFGRFRGKVPVSLLLLAVHGSGEKLFLKVPYLVVICHPQIMKNHRYTHGGWF